jgi:lipopolysaccharide/colanic/teichoic acid biosynthesis glycosyltransferase
LFYPILKHFFDKVFALIAFIVLSPLILLIGIVLFIDLKAWPVFVQKRPGYHQKIFSIYKFKTMRDTKDEKGALLPDFERVTRLGKIIRQLSLDELPQLINVLIGQMSFVGPRPLLPEYLPLYSVEQNKRHQVKPGITGWAQVNGRNALSWQEKFNLDIYYRENQSFVLDLKILIKTVGKIILPKDVNAGEQLTMERFNGKN